MSSDSNSTWFATLCPPKALAKWVTWVLCIGAVALVGTVVVARHYLKWLPRSIVYVPNTDKTINPADDPPIERLAELGVSQQLRVDVGPPAASLCVWIVDPPTSHPIAGKRLRGTILVLHGIQANKDPMLGVGRKLAAAGYRGILVDSRGHGRSSGQWATYGVLESHDLSQLLDTLNRQGLLASPVGAYGVSYGAATAILLAGIDPRVRAVVAVAPFATMRDEVHHYIRRFVPSLLITNAQIDKSIDAAGRLANFDPQAASPLWAIGETKAQVLLIHGKADRKISCQQSEALHAAAPDHSELVLVDGEDHDSILTDPASPVVADMLKWFDHWL